MVTIKEIFKIKGADSYDYWVILSNNCRVNLLTANSGKYYFSQLEQDKFVRNKSMMKLIHEILEYYNEIS